jgi:hypothetical protein
MTAGCAWVGRSRPVRVDMIGLGAGLFGMLRLVCECGSEPDVEVVSVGTTPPLPADPGAPGKGPT